MGDRYAIEVDLRALFDSKVRELLLLIPLDEELLYDMVLRYWEEFELEPDDYLLNTVLRYITDMGECDGGDIGEKSFNEAQWRVLDENGEALLTMLMRLRNKLKPYIDPYMRDNSRARGIVPIMDGVYGGQLVITFESYGD